MENIKRVHFIKGFQFWLITTLFYYFVFSSSVTSNTERITGFISSFIMVFLILSVLVFIKRKVSKK